MREDRDDGLDLPVLEDGNDVQLEKEIEEDAQKYESLAKADQDLIQTFEK